MDLSILDKVTFDPWDSQSVARAMDRRGSSALADTLLGKKQKAPPDLEGQYAQLLDQIGTPMGAMLQSDINRGVLPGAKSPWSEGMSPTNMAELDRYAWGAQAGLGGLPVAAGYEALKGASRIPGLDQILPAVASAMGFEDTGAQFQQDETSSPASFGNLAAYIKGALRPGR